MVSDISGSINAQIVFPGQEIKVGPDFLHGKNTMMVKDKLVATVCGFVQQVNKLVIVVPIRSRYNPHIGDLVVGRIDDIGQQRWNVDIGAAQRSQLMLTAIQLPDAAQRRRTHQDALEMRKFFVEGDILSAEVQKVDLGSESSHLHTRTAKYGRMENGIVVQVQASLVGRQSSHLAILSCGVQVMLGVNGKVFIGAAPKESAMDTLNFTKNKADEYKHVEVDLREKIARVRNCVVALGNHHKKITMGNIERLFASSVNLGVTAKDLLDPVVSRPLIDGMLLGGEEDEDVDME